MTADLQHTGPFMFLPQGQEFGNFPACLHRDIDFNGSAGRFNVAAPPTHSCDYCATMFQAGENRCASCGAPRKAKKWMGRTVEDLRL